MIWLVATAAAPAFCFNLFLLPSSPISPRLNHHSLAIWGPIDSETTRFSSIRLRACLRDDGDRIMSTPDQTSVAPPSLMCTGRAGATMRPLNLRWRDADDDADAVAVAAAVVRLINEEESERASRIGG